MAEAEAHAATAAVEAPEAATSAWGDLVDNLQRASDEALEIFYSAFNISGAGAREGADEGLGWGSVNKEGEGRKQFYFGDPSEYDLSDINGPRTQWSLFKSNVKGFVQAIEWTEPWLIGLACLYVFLLVTAVLTRHNNTVQIGLFVSIMASVYMAERLNTIAAANWQSFSTQNYFDKRGVFISTLWSTPLLLIGTVMLFQNLYNSASLLIQVKRRQLRQQMRTGPRQKPDEAAPNVGASGPESKKSK